MYPAMHGRRLAKENDLGQALVEAWEYQHRSLFACLRARRPHSLRHAQSCWIEFTGRQGRRSDDWLLALVPQSRAEDLALLI
jgi:hypothetical protein